MTSFSLYDTILVYVFQRATGAGAAVFPPGTARPERGVLSRNDPISMCERMRKNMNLKRSISLMILAGVLAASLASCAVSSDDPESTKGSSENPQYTYTNDGGNTPVTPTVDPEDVVYTPVNETVYVISENASFRLVSDTSQTATFGLITEMTRTGYSSSWSKVQYEGTEYYVATSALTADDLLGKSFTSCDKTMYATTDNLNVRKYASAENSFSTSLTTLDKDDAVTVIAEGETWCKVEVKDGSSTITGYVNSKYLSNVQLGNFEDLFHDFPTPQKMYVKDEWLNMWTVPYLEDMGGTLVKLEGEEFKNGLPKGYEVTVVSEGEVAGLEWYGVQWVDENGFINIYYIRSGYLTDTPSTGTSKEQILEKYPELKIYDPAKTLYISNDVENEAYGRSTPTRKGDNIAKMLRSKDEVKAVAVGTIAGETPDGKPETRTWCLIEDVEVGYYFVSYDILTSNSDGTPEVIQVSLDEMIATYGFTKLENTYIVKANKDSHPWSAPNKDSEIEDITIFVGDVVTVHATGTTGSGAGTNRWYIIESDGVYYFVLQSLFDRV